MCFLFFVASKHSGALAIANWRICDEELFPFTEFSLQEDTGMNFTSFPVSCHRFPVIIWSFSHSCPCWVLIPSLPWPYPAWMLPQFCSIHKLDIVKDTISVAFHPMKLPHLVPKKTYCFNMSKTIKQSQTANIVWEWSCSSHSGSVILYLTGWKW